MKPKVIVIVGPTAVGKTKYGIDMAIEKNGEIVSADSMQIYKYMDIGTAKPTKEEMQGIKHYMIDIIEPVQNYSVAEYKTDAYKCIEEIVQKGKLPIVVGGTGLYINSLIYNIQYIKQPIDEEYRNSLRDIAIQNGGEVLYNQLKEIDPVAANKIYSTDLKRIIRALEVYKVTGKTITYYEEQSRKIAPPYDFEVIGLDMDRAVLYDRINKRVDNMLDEGLIDEVERILDMGVKSTNTSMQGLGYKELVSYLNGNKSLDVAIDKIKQESRRYAKRQLTWFRAIKNINWQKSIV